jgi:sec-independent protein translocase protein TatA
MRFCELLTVALLAIVSFETTSAAFVAPVSRQSLLSSSSHSGATWPTSPFHRQPTASFLPQSVQNQRKSVANIQTMGLFGLGVPEIAIILVAALFVLGPEKISEMVRASGKVAGELKDELRDVPKEFQKGLEEGETNARSTKAKKMDPVPDDE